MREGDLTPAEKGRLGSYGLRALSYVREYCPTRFATITDPVSFFSDLATQMRDQVLAIEGSLSLAHKPGEDWVQGVGEANMTHLMAEEQVFSEMLYQAMPTEVTPGEEDDPRDETGAYRGGPAGWEPLLPPLLPEEGAPGSEM